MTNSYFSEGLKPPTRHHVFFASAGCKSNDKTRSSMFFLQHGSHIVCTLQGLDGSHFKSSHPSAIWIMRGSYLSRHRSRPESLCVNGEHAGSVDVCSIVWAPKFTLPKLARRSIPTYPIYSEFYGQFSDEQCSSGYQLPSMPIFCCKQHNNDLWCKGTPRIYPRPRDLLKSAAGNRA